MSPIATASPRTHEDAGRYSLVLANPPFAGSLDYEATAKDLQQVAKTKKTELLFLALFLRLLKVGGRAAVIVPDGVLFGSSKAHKDLRRMLVEDHKLDAVIKLPSGVFRPYAGVSTAILVFTKTGVGGTDFVWFYDVQADGWSLDDKRQPLLLDDKLGPTPEATLTDPEAAKNNLPDLLKRWVERDGAERTRPRTAQSFCVPRADIVAAGYDLSLNRYRTAEREEITHGSPTTIITDLRLIETEIADGMKPLEEMIEVSISPEFDRTLIGCVRGHVKRPLGDVLEFRNEIVHPKDHPQGVVTFVGLEHVERDTGARIGSERLLLEEMKGRRARFHKGDIVYGYLRPYLNKVWIAEFDGICSVDQYVFRVRPDVDRNYIAHFLRSPEFLTTAPVESSPGQLPRIRSGRSPRRASRFHLSRNRSASLPSWIKLTISAESVGKRSKD